MRLIDADNLVPDICDAEIEYGTKPVHFSANAIDFAQTVDAVEVIRCKDCARCVPYKGIPICNKWRTFPEVELDGFCSYGERKGADNG